MVSHSRTQRIALLVASFVFFSLVPEARAKDGFRYPEGSHGRGELRYHDDIPVLIVKGTHAEMGDQIGMLALKPAIKAMQLVEGFADHQIPANLRPVADAAMQAMYAQFPLEYRQELEAMAEASGVAMKSVVMANTIIDLQELVGCSSLMVTADRSAIGAPLYGRNMDLPYVEGLAEFSLLIIYVPDNGHAFAMPNLPGFLMLASGINEWGLALGAQSVGPPKDGSSRFNPTGIASAVAGRRLMEECRDVDAVNLWLKKNRLVRSVSIASCDPNRHVVFEVTTSRVLTRSDDGGVCCATNHFRVAALASNTGCSRYSELEALKKSNRLDLSSL
jgi:isopenicillin-N N-acyltransferase like protein